MSCLFCYMTGLFCHIIGLFCHIIGLFCYMIGLLCYKTGLFCHTLLAKCRDINQSGEPHPGWGWWKHVFWIFTTLFTTLFCFLLRYLLRYGRHQRMTFMFFGTFQTASTVTAGLLDDGGMIWFLWFPRLEGRFHKIRQLENQDCFGGFFGVLFDETLCCKLQTSIS